MISFWIRPRWIWGIDNPLGMVELKLGFATLLLATREQAKTYRLLCAVGAASLAKEEDE